MQSLPPQVIESFDHPYLAWSTWRTMFTEICDRRAPLKSTTVYGDPCPSLSNNVKEMTRQRDYFHRKAISTKSENDWKSYKNLRNEVTLQMRKVKKNYFKTQISNSNKDTMRTWSTLKKLLPKSSKSPNIIEIGKKIRTSPVKIAILIHILLQLALNLMKLSPIYSLSTGHH